MGIKNVDWLRTFVNYTKNNNTGQKQNKDDPIFMNGFGFECITMFNLQI